RNSRRRLLTSTILSRPQWTKALGPILKWFGTGAFVVLKRAPAARNDAAAHAYMRDAILRWYRRQRRSRWIGPRPPNRTCAAPEAITSNQCKEDANEKKQVVRHPGGHDLRVRRQTRRCRRHAHDPVGGVGSRKLPAGAGQRLRKADRRKGQGRDRALALLPDQGVHRVQRQGRRLRHGGG